MLNKKIDEKIVYSIIILLIVSGGFYYFKQLKHSYQIVNSFPPTPDVSAYPLYPSPTENPAVAVWKTYISNTVGYTFKAPSDWEVIHKEADPKKGYGEFDYNFVFTPTVVGVKQPTPFDNNFAVVEIQFPGNYEFTHINSDSLKTTIEGRTTYTSKTVFALNPPANFRGDWCSGCSEKDVYIDAGYNDVRLPIVARWNKGSVEFEKVFDQMIETIHFTRSQFIWNAPPIYMQFS